MPSARFDEILEHLAACEVDFIVVGTSSGRTVRVLSLPALIDAKERSGRPKDLAALPVLRTTLDEQSKRG